MAGIYIHIPFCKQACHYCDFHFSTNQTLIKEVGKAIEKELQLQKDYLDQEPIETIYFGGGTPSLLSISELNAILNSIKTNYLTSAQVEITLEANPDDLNGRSLVALREIGINRLSLGIQSFNDPILKFLNRSHDARQARDAIQHVKEVGFDSVNLDLIYAIPGGSPESLIRDLDAIIAFSPEHISAYSLTIEEKTVFGKWSSSKKFVPVPDHENANQFELVMDKLSLAGYEQYEISNYSKPGFISKHNSNYWAQKKYLGVGPSAHSFNGISRQVNAPNNHTYLKSINSNTIPAIHEILTREDQINEYLMTSLRTKWGCDLNYLIEHHQYDLLNCQGSLIKGAISNRLMMVENNALKLTRAGKMHADKLSSDLFLIP